MAQGPPASVGVCHQPRPIAPHAKPCQAYADDGSSKKKPGVQLNADQAARIPFHNRYGCCICRKARTQRVLALHSAIEIKLTVEYEQPALERNDYQRASAGHVCDCIILALALIQTGHNRELMNSGDAIGADEVRCAPLIR